MPEGHGTMSGNRAGLVLVAPTLQGLCPQARPGPPKGRPTGQFRKRWNLPHLDHRIAQLKECITSVAQLTVDRLTKLD